MEVAQDKLLIEIIKFLKNLNIIKLFRFRLVLNSLSLVEIYIKFINNSLNILGN